MDRLKETASVQCPWCKAPLKLVVKKEMIYLPRHRGALSMCKGSDMPVAFNREGDEPTDGWQ